MRTGCTMASTRSSPETVVSPEQQGRVTEARSLARPTRMRCGSAGLGVAAGGGASATGGAGAGAGAGLTWGAAGGTGAGRLFGRDAGRGAVFGRAGWVEPAQPKAARSSRARGS